MKLIHVPPGPRRSTGHTPSAVATILTLGTAAATGLAFVIVPAVTPQAQAVQTPTGYYEATSDQGRLEVVDTNSQEIKDNELTGDPAFAIDGNPETIWHSVWNTGAPGRDKKGLPVYLIVGTKDGAPVTGADAIGFMPRSSSQGSGRFAQFSVSVKENGPCGIQDGYDNIATVDVPKTDKSTQWVPAQGRAISCIRVDVTAAWDGSDNPSNSASLAELTFGTWHAYENGHAPQPEGTGYQELQLPAEAVSSRDILTPLALDERRADDPNETPIALAFPQEDGSTRIVGARQSQTPATIDPADISGTTYHVDCQAQGAGTGTQEEPFTSLDAINEHDAFQPGDAIVFKRGTVCDGLLHPRGSGEAERPIMIDAYGEANAPLPVINAWGQRDSDTERIPQVLNGSESAVVRLYNQEHWRIRHLELTNYTGDSRDYNERRRGIVVALEDYGRGVGYEISDVYIHDVLGEGKKDLGGSGGIQFEASAGAQKKATSFEGIEVHHNVIRHVNRSGINEGSSFRSRSSVGGSVRDNAFEVWGPMNVHDNIVSDVGGDAIVTQFASASQITNNTAYNTSNYHAGASRSGSNAALWPWDADHVYYGNNHVFATVRHRGNNDGTAFDADYGTTGTTFEYNVSHDNQGGFMLFCGCGGLSTKTVMRYNISINDGLGAEKNSFNRRLFFMAGQTDGEVYNNTFLLLPDTTIDQGAVGGSATAVAVENNVYLAQGAIRTVLPSLQHGGVKYRGNLFTGVTEAMSLGSNDQGGNFVEAGAGPLRGKADEPATTVNQALDYLRASEESVVGRGRTIARVPLTDVLGKWQAASGPIDLGALAYTGVERSAADTSASVVRNGGFEKHDNAAVEGWEGSGVQGSQDPRTGFSLALPDGRQISQEVTASVNRTYRLVAAVRADAQGHFPQVAISNPRGMTAVAQTQELGEASGDGWVGVSTLIRTAWDATTLTLTLTGPGEVDDVSLLPVDDYMVDGSFESVGNSPWRGAGSLSRTDDAVSGSMAAEVSSAKSWASAEHGEVVVPQTGVRYELAGWAKTVTAPSMEIGAKRFGDTEDLVKVSTQAKEYTLLRGHMTPQAGVHGAVYCYAGYAAGSGRCDDVMVVRAWDGTVPAISEPVVEEEPATPVVPAPEPVPSVSPVPVVPTPEPASPVSPAPVAPSASPVPSPVPEEPSASPSPSQAAVTHAPTAAATGKPSAASLKDGKTSALLASTGATVGSSLILAAVFLGGGVLMLARRRAQARH